MDIAKPNDSLAVLEQIGTNLPYSKHSPISIIICDRMKEAILSGALPGGYCFPNEMEICGILNIGRSTLREAYSQLQLLGLITRTKNGTFVNERNVIACHMDYNAVINQSDMKEILDFRRVVELAVVVRAAERITDEDARELEDILKEQEVAAKAADPLLLTDVNYRFHTAIAARCGNSLLLMTLNSVRPKFKNASLCVFSKNHNYTLDEHRAIVKALKQHDPEAARKAMEAHLDSIARNIELMDE